MKKIFLLFLLSLMYMAPAFSQRDSLKNNNWSTHFQMTVISQWHAGFHALYSGKNSLKDSADGGATTMTGTVFLGRRLWKGAALYFNPEISGGKGLSGAQGVGGALNGESYRVGNAEPSVFIARAYLRQHIFLGGGDEQLEDGENQLAERVTKDRITITAGKFAISDFYDDNAYSHNPRNQFLNWSLMSNGAWDYPANTRGYTMGVVAELVKGSWGVKLSSVAVPRIANAPKMEYDLTRAHSETLELSKDFNLNKRPGSVRLLVSNTYTKAPSYADGLRALGPDGDKNILAVIGGETEGTVYKGRKTGLGLSAEQELSNDMGVFFRAGWNDGKYATWSFTEIDQSVSGGLSLKGTRWSRPDDTFGLAVASNGISQAHRDFLKAGGYGFIIGDGQLNYSRETIIEAYYSARFFAHFWLSGDYQFVNNPAYNRDRGPVHAFAVRAHIAF